MLTRLLINTPHVLGKPQLEFKGALGLGLEVIMVYYSFRVSVRLVWRFVLKRVYIYFLKLPSSVHV